MALLLCWKVSLFDFIGSPLEPPTCPTKSDLCEPILRKLISIKLFPNWHTSFTTTLYLHTIEFRYLPWYTIGYIYSQTWPKLSINSKHIGGLGSRWDGLPCWLMPRLQSRLCVVFAPLSPRNSHNELVTTDKRPDLQVATANVPTSKPTSKLVTKVRLGEPQKLLA